VRSPARRHRRAPSAGWPLRAPWYTTLLAVHALLCVLAFLAVSSLLLFHVIICIKGQTTYEWLVEDMQKRREGVKPCSIVMQERKEELEKWYVNKCAPRPNKAGLKEVEIQIRA
jgi:hypothetical protein